MQTYFEHGMGIVSKFFNHGPARQREQEINLLCLLIRHLRDINLKARKIENGLRRFYEVPSVKSDCLLSSKKEPS